MREMTMPIQFYATEKDNEMLSERAKRMGVSKSEVLRDLVRGCQLVEAPPADYPFLIRELRAIGNNLNQTLVIAKSNGILNIPDLRKEILELRELEKKISSQFDLK